MVLTVSRVAARSGISPDAVRYYEKAGLLPPAPRSPAGYREYAPEVVDRIRFIKAAQEMGLRLSEIAEVLEIQDRGACPCGHTKALVERHMTEIDAEIQRLTKLRNQLAAMAQQECPPTTQSDLWPCQIQFLHGEEVSDDRDV